MKKYIAINILNIADWALTTYWTSLHGIGVEANPIMRLALVNPWVFGVVKLILFPLFLLWLWHKKHDDTAWMALGMFIVVVLMNVKTVFC